MKQLVCFLLVFVTLLLSGARTSRAVLISIDLDSPGDGLLTRDTASSLEWLDLTKSTGLSWDDVEAGAGGLLARGFRHATEVEVRAVLTQLGLGGTAGDLRPAFFDPARAFISLFGCLSNCTFFFASSVGLVDEVPANSGSALAFSVEVNGIDYSPHRAPGEMRSSRTTR